MRSALCAAAAAALLAASPAHAQDGPEQLEQIEPGAGEWQLEYYGIHAGDGEHSFQALAGVSDWFALGGEIEFDERGGGFHFDTIGMEALVRFADPEAKPVGLGIDLQLSMDRDARLAGIEGRAILETRSANWWGQADLILRHAREDGEQGTGLAYSGSISRAIGEGIWFGVEASGQLARLGGAAELAPEGRHYAGPAVALERELGKTGVELGAAWLQRWRGAGRSGPRLFVQLTF